MSSQSSRFPANAYAWYHDENGPSLDFISQPSRPFPITLNEGGGVDPWLQPARILTLPNSSMIRFPQPLMQLVVFRNNLANNTSLRSRPTTTTTTNTRQDFELNPDEQKKAIMNLKKEVYNPIPKKIIQRVGHFYSQNAARKADGSQQTNKGVEENNDNDGSSCVICLEEFQSKQVVMVSPCNHMFHEDCILPWVKSHGKCPVCRFSFADRNNGASRVSSTNTNNLPNNQFPDDLISLVRSMRTIEPFRF